MIGRTLGHYRIVEQVGAGGMGVVYRAHDERLERDVALKVLPPGILIDESARKRFRKEALALSRLNHPNIATVFDFDTQDCVDFLVTELVGGMSLDARVIAGALPEKDVVQLGMQMAEGLEAAHREGVIHRDLKPANLQVTPEGRVKILDFGLAKCVDPADRQSVTQSATEHGGVAGTLAYMAPEQLRGEKVDARSDLWSAGVVLYELATGRQPFEGATATSLSDEILHAQAPSPQLRQLRLSSRLTDIIQKCLEKDAGDRYQSAKELAVDLRRLSSASSASAVPLSPERKSKRVALAAGVALFAVLAIAFGLNVGGLRERLLTRGSERRLSIAVLPLKNMSGDPQQDYFSDGITEDIISRLAGIPGLKVISHTSVEQYKKTTKNLKEIARELDVDTILEGSVRREGNRVRIVAQLIDARKDEHLWVETYDRDLSDIFAVQSEVATQIAGALKANLSAPLKEQIKNQPTANLEAYEAYLQGIRYQRTDDAQHTLGAIALFEQAVKLDPEFALAYAVLSEAHSKMWFYTWDRRAERVNLAKAAVDKALALQPDLPEAHRAMGTYYYWCRLDYPRALEQFDLARRRKPGDALTVAMIGYVQRRQGRTAESLATLLQALELDPRRVGIVMRVGETYALLRNFQAADRYFDRTLALMPDHLRAYTYKVRLRFRLLNDIEGARNVLHRAQEIGLGDDGFLRYQGILMELNAGNYRAALDLLSSSRVEEFGEQFWFVPKPLLEAQIRDLMGQQELARKKYETARVLIENKIQAGPEDARYHSALGITLAGLGRKEGAIREGLRAVEILPISKEAWQGAYRLEDLARIYAMVGDKDSAIDTLERLMSIPIDLGVAALKLDPSWKSLRNHPRYQELIRRYGG